MTQKILRAAVFAAILALPAAAGAAAVDYFLKIDGIDGESTDDRHKGEIVIESWSFGVSQAAAGAGASRSSKPCVSDISLAKLLDKATPQLMANAVSGMTIPKAVLTARKAGGSQQEYLSFELKNVLVTSYSAAGSGDSAPMDSFSLNFGTLIVEYRPQNPDGSLGSPTTATFKGGC